MRPREASAAPRAPSQWPLLVVVVGVVAGLAIALAGDHSWRLGALVMGASLGVGALERMALPDRRAGLLQVRGRIFDVAVLALAGVAIMVLALIVPEGR